MWNGKLYHPKGIRPGASTLRHELIHEQQQEDIGKWKFLFLYLFCCPLFYNPWRYKWEMTAFIKGSYYSKSVAKSKLKSLTYGWLLNK